MSGVVPFFITGGNCKIRVNGVTLAFATDLSYKVVINHIPAKLLGVYEADTIEPISYSVSGQFTVIKYISDLKSALNDNGYGSPYGVSNEGDGIGSFTTNLGNNLGSLAGRTVGNFSGDGAANENLNPSKLSTGQWFDIEIYQKIPVKTNRPGESRFIGLVAGQNSDITGATTEFGQDLLGISRLRDCRIIGADVTFSKRDVARQTYYFLANYLDEDSFLAMPSK